MSAQVCPVCGGKGLVPKGFYDVSSNPPQYKCIVDNTFHFAYDSCDKYKEQEPVYLYNASLLNNQDK